jgi:ribosome maturation factor RimP
VLRLQRDWYAAIGEFVELRLHDQTVREGVIDAVTGDDAILWLAADGIHQRQLFTREDGYQVWIGSPASTERGF